MKRTQRSSVLVVDDNIVDRESLREQFARLGIRADTASGADAIICINEHNYALILMNVDMPEMNSFEITLAIRKTEKESQLEPIPIIGMSSEIDVHRCKDCGMDECARKPIQVNTLRAIVFTWLKECTLAEIAPPLE